MLPDSLHELYLSSLWRSTKSKKNFFDCYCACCIVMIYFDVQFMIYFILLKGTGYSLIIQKPENVAVVYILTALSVINNHNFIIIILADIWNCHEIVHSQEKSNHISQMHPNISDICTGSCYLKCVCDLH